MSHFQFKQTIYNFLNMYSYNTNNSPNFTILCQGFSMLCYILCQGFSTYSFPCIFYVRVSPYYSKSTLVVIYDLSMNHLIPLGYRHQENNPNNFRIINFSSLFIEQINNSILNISNRQFIHKLTSIYLNHLKYFKRFPSTTYKKM